MRLRHLLAVSALFVAAGANAQSTPVNHIALGDREFAALNASAALGHYKEAADADPGNYEAQWKTARSAVDLASYDMSGDAQTKMFAEAELYARRAVAANPNDAEGHFHLARALGKRAQSLGARQKIKYATDVRAHALDCLKLNPKHAGCLHVMGVWNAEVMRLNGFMRMIAKNLLGGKVFGSASWAEAQRYMEESVASEPNRIVHHLDLAAIYKDRDMKANAHTQYQAVIDLPVADYNDRHYKAEAAAALKSL
jgi:tetratricopeptide (TPR) repeat protein